MDKIIEFFIKEPEKEFHIRQISKITGKSPTTISKYLKGLEKQGILKSESRLNHLLFKADIDSSKFKREKLNYNLNQISDSGLVDYINKYFNHPEAIILFGSFAKSENTSKSDLDILIISSSKKQIDLDKFEKRLGFSVQIFIRSNEQIEKMKKTNKELLNNFLNGIILSGFWEIFR